MSRIARNALLAGLFVLLLARVPYAATNMDGARDWFAAWQLLRGEALPLLGPVFNGAIHLGPIWFYFLALVLALTGSNWLAALLVVGAFAAMQVPFAYLAGKELLGRRAGLCWAAALLLPSWAALAMQWPSHPQLAATLVLAFMVCAARHARSARPRYLYGMALSFSLAVHAHPACLGLAWPALFVIARGWWRAELRPRHLAGAALLALAPLAPLAWWNATHGFADFDAGSAYLAGPDFVANLAHAGRLFRALVAGAAPWWFGSVFAWPAALVTGLSALATGTVVLGLAGSAWLLRDPQRRGLAMLAWAVFAAILLGTAAMREVTPFYMTIPVQVALAGLVGIGFAAIGDGGAARLARGGLLLLAFLIGIAMLAGTARVQTRGAWPFAWHPAMDVKQPAGETTPYLLLPAYAMGASGRFLCAREAPSIHGAYAAALLQDYAIEMRLACGRRDVLLGGDDAAREHWIGLSRAMFAQLDMEPELRLGPVGLARARAIAPAVPIGMPEEPRYPAYQPRRGAAQSRHWRLELQAGQHVALTNLAAAFDSPHDVVATIDGRPLPVRAHDGASRVFACDGCGPDRPAVVELRLRGADLDAIDVVVF